MGDKKELLKEALETQFKDVSEGTDGQKKKESVETLQIMYNLALAQDKADQDSEFRESEMQLKEREMALKEAEQKAREEKDKEELKLKEAEVANKAAEVEIKRIEVQTKSDQATSEATHKCRELDIKEREIAIRKSELLMKKIEMAAGISIPVLGTYLYQKNFNRIYKFETETIQTVSAQRALQHCRLMEKLAINGVKSIFRR